MTKSPQMHYQVSEGFAGCGIPRPPEWLTEEQTEVSCASCMRGWTPSERRSWANKKARTMPGYSDPDYKGTGKLTCYVCGRPIRVHPKWPCNLRVDVRTDG